MTKQAVIGKYGVDGFSSVREVKPGNLWLNILKKAADYWLIHREDC